MSCKDKEPNKLLIELLNNHPDALKYFIEQDIIKPVEFSEYNKTNQPLDSDDKKPPQVS
jgi:hypothetical protein